MKNGMFGIIPACAGSTGLSLPFASVQRDHPRMCGEHVVEKKSRRGYKGSSPHVRGAPSTLRRCCCRNGIIPACAGSTVRRVA